MDGDVAAVVDVGAANARLGAEETHQLISHGASHGSHGRDELVAVRPAGLHHALGYRSGHSERLLHREAQQLELVHQLSEHALEARPCALDCAIDGSRIAVGTDDEIDRAVLKMPAAVIESSAKRTAGGSCVRVRPVLLTCDGRGCAVHYVVLTRRSAPSATGSSRPRTGRARARS